ncbi:MAG: diguanylate cyclase [Pseudomonadota bacterium]|nr:diguanylate cyclase [Pseudomonadota bacterium]
MTDNAYLSQIHAEELDKFVVYGDLNCPFCFALHERFAAWELLDKIEWRLIVHAPELSDTFFSLEDESLLANEVFAIHHRAPDVSVSLPRTRPESSLATRLVMAIDKYDRKQVADLRLELYRALWQEGLNLGDPAVLETILAKVGLGNYVDSSVRQKEDGSLEALPLLEFWRWLGPEPQDSIEWQERWETDVNFDRRIPIIENRSNNALLRGLPTEEALYQYLVGRRAHFVNDDVCVFQPRPITIVFGWMDHLWPLVKILRETCEVLHYSELASCRQMLVDNEEIDFLIIEDEFIDDDGLSEFAELLKTRGVSWVLAAQQPTEEAELRSLRNGAVEHMSVDSSEVLHRARIAKLVADRRRITSMERDARFDGMTQVANRREFQYRIEQEWQRIAERGSGSLSLLMIDLDYFKPYNDTYGHLAGDICLKKAASVLKSKVKRSSDLVARYGGEEFAVLLPETVLEQAIQVAERLRQALIEEELEHKASPFHDFVTASIGVATVEPGVQGSVGDLIKAADDNLYSAKSGGRNQVASNQH